VGKLSGLCNIVCNNCEQCNEQTNSSLDDVLSHWAHFTVLRFIFVYMCILRLLPYIMCFIIVTRWGGLNGIEAWSFGPLFPSVLLILLIGSFDP